MSHVVCPVCRKQFDPATSDAPPFCGKRCRQIDLGRWLDERYSFPASRHKDDDGGEAGEQPAESEDE